MAKRVQNVYQWYPRLADHYNLINNYRYKLFSKIEVFIENVFYKKSVNTSMNNSSLIGKYLNSNSGFKLVDIKEEASFFKTYGKEFNLSGNELTQENEINIYKTKKENLLKSDHSNKENYLMHRKTENETLSTDHYRRTIDNKYLMVKNTINLFDLNQSDISNQYYI